MLKSLGDYIRVRRQELGLTQEQLADRVGDGVRQAEISRLESGRVFFPRRERLIALAAALDISMGDLLLKSGWIEERHLYHHDGLSIVPTSDGQPEEAARAKAVRDLSELLDTVVIERARLNELARAMEQVELTLTTALSTFEVERDPGDEDPTPAGPKPASTTVVNSRGDKRPASPVSATWQANRVYNR